MSAEIYAHCMPLTWQSHYLGGIVCCILLVVVLSDGVVCCIVKGAPEGLSAFVGPGVRICDRDSIAEKNLWGPKVLPAFVGPGVRICDGDRAMEKTVLASKSFSIATKSGMTA